MTQSGGKTASSGLSALPSSHYATDSSIGFSEYPSSTTIDESSFVKQNEQAEHYATDSSIGFSEYPSSTVIDESSFVKENKQTKQQLSTTTEAHFDKPSTEKKSKRGASVVRAYQSMKIQFD